MRPPRFKAYLAAVGIDVQLDVADTARFTSLTWDTTGKNAWKDSLILSNMPLDPGLLFTDMFIRYFKPGARFASLARSPEFADSAGEMLRRDGYSDSAFAEPTDGETGEPTTRR